MKSHVTKGAEILKSFTIVDHVEEGALYHHERYDGKGYVHGLKGEEIPINARIIGIADTFDAMTANRVYRKQLDMAYVIQELKNGRGTQFDPGLVDVMLGLIDNGKIDICSLYKEHAHADHSREKEEEQGEKSISCDIVHLSGCDCSCVGICILSERRRKRDHCWFCVCWRCEYRIYQQFY